MPRSRLPSSAFSIASGRPSSRKKSAGPPMPKDVREASGSSSAIPGSARSQARLDLVRQLIAQLLDVARAHQQHEVVGPDDVLERFLRGLEVTHVKAIGDLVREVGRAHTGCVLLARAVHVEDIDAVRAFEGAREVVHQRAQPGVAVGLENDDQAAVAQLAGGLYGGP